MAGRVLILSASAGAGHMRAAQAVELALKQLDPQAVVRNTDVLSLTNTAFRRFYGSGYLDLVNKAPHVLGYVYDYMDRPRRPKSARDRLRLAMEKINLTKLCDVLECQSWDVIVNTHFLSAEIIASLRKAGKIYTPHITVTTDFETHRLWVNEPCEQYTTATEEGAEYLHHWGVPREHITVTGIPIHPVFSAPKDRAECRRLHGLAEDRPVILQLAGGFGVGPLEKLLGGILSLERPVQVAVVAGKNVEAKEKLETVEVPARHRVKIFGFTDRIDELMAAADIVVTKPGGLTSSEVLARGVAMVIVNPIPGQESRNSDYLLENGAAIKVNNVATLPLKLSRLLNEPDRLSRLKANACKLGHANAAFDVARLAMSRVRTAAAST